MLSSCLQLKQKLCAYGSHVPCHEQAKRSSLTSSRPRSTRNVMKKSLPSIVVKLQLMWILATSLTRFKLLEMVALNEILVACTIITSATVAAR